jgi:exosortase J
VSSPSVAVQDNSSISAAATSWTLIAFALILGLGLACMPRLLESLWYTWTNDPIRSIGLLAIPVSLILTARALQGFRWQPDGGTWWGLVLIAAALIAAQFWGSWGGVILRVYPGQIISFVPKGVPIWAYASGAVLLFGGTDAWLPTKFPLALLLLVNPVPEFFLSVVDLPLQYLAAHTARGFASLLSVPISGRNLELMFSPGFGVFIAPECNGLTGAVTMGLVALVTGYLYRMKPLGHALYVTSAVMLGYVLNFVRLCLLVLYYWVAARSQILAEHAAGADYVIGGVLFFVAVSFILRVPRGGLTL